MPLVRRFRAECLLIDSAVGFFDHGRSKVTPQQNLPIRCAWHGDAFRPWERRRQRTRCVTVDVNQSERDALVVRGYLSEEDRDNGAAIKKAIEGVISDIVFELQSEAAERCRARV